jgi:hypothetical protein
MADVLDQNVECALRELTIRAAPILRLKGVANGMTAQTDPDNAATLRWIERE